MELCERFLLPKTGNKEKLKGHLRKFSENKRAWDK